MDFETRDFQRIIVGYGYGFLAVFIISVLSLVGLAAVPCINKNAFQYVLAFFTALAVGTLFGDAMFHLIPFVSNERLIDLLDFLVLDFRLTQS